MKNLSLNNSIINHYLRELRDQEIQKDKRRFAYNLEQIGILMGYELSKQLNYVNSVVQTPLGKTNLKLIKDEIVIATVLRAGLPLQQGLAQIFNTAELAFVAAGRKPETEHGVEIDLSYVATNNLNGKTLILADTMLATGHSMHDAYMALIKYGKPQRVFIVSVIASQPGVDYVKQNMPKAEIVTAAPDPELSDQFFIVPGLGDAGDLLYGTKL